MTTYIVEHKHNGHYVMETISGVEDIDTSVYKNIMGIWVCASDAEARIMEDELRKMRHARYREQA